jgi:hypothetical protein
MSVITTISQAVYFTLRKNLGREQKKPKTPVISSFFKKLRTEQDKYNKAISPARKSLIKELNKIYSSVLTSIHKKPRVVKPEEPKVKVEKPKAEKPKAEKIPKIAKPKVEKPIIESTLSYEYTDSTLSAEKYTSECVTFTFVL